MVNNKGIKMSLKKEDQDALEIALASLKTKEKLLDELQATRDALNAALDLLAAEGGLGPGYDLLKTDPIREDNKKTRL